MPRIVCISDLHGQLPERLPAGDVLVIAGDLCPMEDHGVPFQARWLEHELGPWVAGLDFEHVVGIAGNHDFVFAQAPMLAARALAGFPASWTYLQDSEGQLTGLRLYGTPAIPPLAGWAFELSHELLAERFDAIPDGLDLLITHVPPQGILDVAHGMHLGAVELTRRLVEARPRAIVFGHIHEGWGALRLDERQGGVVCVNASLLDGGYRLANAPLILDLEQGQPPEVSVADG